MGCRRSPLSSTRSRTLALLAALAMLGIRAGASLAITIDPLTTPFPPNPSLPVTQAPVLFVGDYCDGAACPPGTVVSHGTDLAVQSGVPGVLGGTRRAELHPEFTGMVESIDPVAHRVVFTPPFDGECFGQLRYGTVTPLHANLLADGSSAFLLDVSVSSPSYAMRFVSFCVQVTSHWYEPNEASAVWCMNIASPGTLRFDFASFPGIDFSQIDEISLAFYDELLPDIQFSAGPFGTDGGPTPARTTSWGRLKTIYR